MGIADKNMKDYNITIKCHVKERNPGENIEGISYIPEGSSRKKNHDILGVEILSYEEVDKVPDSYTTVNEDFFWLYDAEGVNLAYSSDKDQDWDHFVKARSVYACFNSENEEDELNNIQYIDFTPENYSKFCSMFKKENRMFYLTY